MRRLGLFARAVLFSRDTHAAQPEATAGSLRTVSIYMSVSIHKHLTISDSLGWFWLNFFLRILALCCTWASKICVGNTSYWVVKPAFSHVNFCLARIDRRSGVTTSPSILGMILCCVSQSKQTNWPGMNKPTSSTVGGKSNHGSFSRRRVGHTDRPRSNYTIVRW